MAAGKGTRMKSAHPKVLHTLAGRSLLQHVLNAVAGLQADQTLLIVGHGADAVRASVAGSGALCVLQEPQLGTGHAVQQAVPHLPDGGTTLILNGDVPLIEPATAAALVAACGGTQLALLTIELADATGYGRIVRNGKQEVRAIVEHKDASEAERAIREVYTGMLAAPTAWLKRAVMALKNRQHAERVLPDRHRRDGGGRRSGRWWPRRPRARPKCSASTARCSSPTSSAASSAARPRR